MGDAIRESWAPTNPSDLAAFAGKVAAHYRGKIHVWEFLNEPIFTSYALPGSRYNAADYVSLLKPTAEAIHRADPGCRIIGGGASSPTHLTKEMIDAGVLDSIDILNLHIYPGLDSPERYLPEMERLNQRMDALHKRRPIWITEFSYYGADDPTTTVHIPGTNWEDSRMLNDEKQCADYTVRFFALMLEQGVERIFIHAGTNEPVNTPSVECCLFDGNAPRKVAPAVAQFCSFLGSNAKPAGYHGTPGGAYSMGFETGKQAVVVAWSTGISASPRPPSGFRAFDEMGNMISGPIHLSESPVYLVGPSGSAKQALAAIQ